MNIVVPPPAYSSPQQLFTRLESAAGEIGLRAFARVVGSFALIDQPIEIGKGLIEAIEVERSLFTRYIVRSSKARSYLLSYF